MRQLPNKMTGDSPLARQWNIMVDYVRGLTLRHDASLESTRTPSGTLLRVARRAAPEVFGIGQVVVIAASQEGPAPYDELTYAVELIDTDTAVPELSSNPGEAIHRVHRFARYAEQIPDGSGGVTGWMVDPARPDTYGVAITYPLYSGGQRIPGETVTVVELFDERVSVLGCADVNPDGDGGDGGGAP